MKLKWWWKNRMERKITEMGKRSRYWEGICSEKGLDDKNI